MHRVLALTALAVAALVLLPVQPAEAVVIDFEADSPGGKPNGFSPVGHPGVQFFDTVGSGLIIGNFFESNNSRALAVLDDTDGSVLDILFAGAIGFFQLDYGNDDPFFTNPGDLAVLTGFLGGAQVGQVIQVLNRNDLMDQTIAIAGLFDRITFAYTDPFLNPFTGGGEVNTGLIEIVDNLEYREQQPVPEPASLALLGGGLAGLALRSRRRRRG